MSEFKFGKFFKYLEDVDRNKVFSSNYQGNEVHKLSLDKYYTPYDIAKRCFDKFIELCGDGVTEIIEPSAGSGVFLPIFKESGIPYRAYDLVPEGEGIEQADFLELPLGYKKGRAFIGNPPFGEKGSLMIKFFKKCCKYGDYVAFILPITMLNNTNSMHEFDLIYSEDLGTEDYSGRKAVHCCFNIFRRPSDGNLKKKEKKDLRDVTIIRNDSPRYEEMDYDFRVVGFGGRSGAVLRDDERDLATTYKIKVNNPRLKDEVGRALSELRNHLDEYRPTTSVRKCQKVNIIDYLKDKVKGIQ